MWTPTELAREFRPYEGRVFRMVEGQHVISTNRLAANNHDQGILEDIIDSVKPRLPDAAVGIHWLLASPFRYGHMAASRFRAAGRREGIFYAAETVETSAAESAYWRLRFEAAMEVPAPPTQVPMTMFNVTVGTTRGLDLTRSPFDAEHKTWTHPSDYARTQAFATNARLAGASLFRAPSARLPSGICVPVIDPTSFRSTPELTASLTFSTAPGKLIASASFPLRFSARYHLLDDQLQVEGGE